MRTLKELTDRLASAVVMADAADPRALADLQRQLRAVADVAVEEIDLSDRPGLRLAVEDAERLVARIISHELEGADSALRAVSDAVALLQRCVEQSAQPTDGDVVTGAVSGAVASHPDAAEGDVHATDLAEEPVRPDDLSLIGDFVAEARGHLETAEAEVLRLEQIASDSESLNAIFRCFHTIKGVAGFLNLRQIGALAQATEGLLDRVRHRGVPRPELDSDLVLEAIDRMKALVDALEAAAPGAAMDRDSALPDLLLRLQACVIAQAQERHQQDAASLQPSSGSTSVEAATLQRLPHSAGGVTVRVATERLDSLANVVGELVIAQAMVSRDVTSMAPGDHRIVRNLSHVGKLTRGLQELATSLRMVPLQGVFRKMARLSRDLARASRKEVEFVVAGGETELDRNLIEAISDPLVHMVRNAVDHGIEPPEIRERAGKPRAGRLQLTARHQSGNVVIQIADDGRGLDAQRIRSKAIEAGLVAEGQELSEQETFRLIFHPGLSTAERITDVSGRGVGMDVVRRSVEAFRGRIDVASTEGQGSTFTIRLPLTLAAIDGLAVRVGNHRYVIPIHGIEQSIRPKAQQLSTIQGRGEACLVRGRLLPLFRLHKLFGIAPATHDLTAAIAVVLEDNGRRCCLTVDELLGQQQVLIKPLGNGMGSVPGVSGGAILGDGNVSLILDVGGLIEMACGNADET